MIILLKNCSASNNEYVESTVSPKQFQEDAAAHLHLDLQNSTPFAPYL